MFKSKSRRASIAAMGVLAASCLSVNVINAADHQEAPAATALLAADIGDYYVWHDNDQLNLILTFGTFAPMGQEATFNRDILYGFHFDTSEPADGVADVDMYARFSQSTDGAWGIQVFGIGDTPLEGAVETVLSDNALTAWAGLADDPFFFNQSGFNETLSTGTLSFDPTQDDVAGLNVTAIAIQLPIESIKSGGGALQSWATTSSL